MVLVSSQTDSTGQKYRILFMHTSHGIITKEQKTFPSNFALETRRGDPDRADGRPGRSRRCGTDGSRPADRPSANRRAFR